MFFKILYENICHVMRARIRAPFDGEIISRKMTRHSNTIDNVKAKIDNVKAKIQDKEKNPGPDPHWQDVQSLASWLHLRPVSH
jgi:hypothetical protein